MSHPSRQRRSCKERRSCKTSAALSLGLAIAVLGTTPTLAQTPADSNTVAPAVAAMLQKAAARDDGVNLQAVTLIAIEADPAKAAAILTEVEKLAPDQGPGIHAAAAAAFPDLQLAAATAPQPKAKRKAKKAPSLLSVKGWNGALELAGNRSTGNTDQTTAAVLGKAVHATDTWTHKLNALFDFERNDGNTSKKRWLAGYDINYDLSPRSYVFGSLQYENDRFARINYRITEAVGFGYRIIRRDDMTFNIEAGPGARQTRFIDNGKESEVTGLARSAFVWNLSDSSAITHDLVYIFGSDQHTVDTTAALKLRIIGALSGQFSYNYRFNSSPPLGTRKTDTVSRVGLVYDF